MFKSSWLRPRYARLFQSTSRPDKRASKPARQSATGRHRLWPSERGNVAIIFALTLPIVAGGAGLGVETSYWYYKDLQIQAAADAAAFAGALEKRSGATNAVILASAKNSAIQNSFDPTLGDIEVNSPPLTGPNTGNTAVEVLITLPLERFFSKLFADDLVVVRARAVARYETSGSACVLALDPSASRSLLFSGSSSLTLSGCTIMTNSIAPDAIRSQGASRVEVDCIVSAGGVDLNTHVKLTECANPITNASPVSDPYADLPVPVAVGACLDDGSGGSSDDGGGDSGKGKSSGKGKGGDDSDVEIVTLESGRYCKGLSINHDTVLSSGTYFVSGGDFSINGKANVSGDDVTIYLDGGARVSMNGTATVNINAPTSGDYSGILFFGDRDSSGGQTNKFNGTADATLTGSLYFASQEVAYLGNFAGNRGCTRIVANTIDWNGNADFSQDCTSLGIRDIPSLQLVRIAE
jgi:hypothetical protein